MELRQARLAAMALVLVLAGCSQLPSPNGSTAKEPAPLRDAPQQVDNASDQLAELAEPVRTDTALAWARSYLVNERADDAGELLDQVGDGALSRDQRFRWLQLRAQSWMAEQQPDRAVALLDDYRSDIDGFDAQRRAKLNLLRADAQAAASGPPDFDPSRVEFTTGYPGHRAVAKYCRRWRSRPRCNSTEAPLGA